MQRRIYRQQRGLITVRVYAHSESRMRLLARSASKTKIAIFGERVRSQNPYFMSDTTFLPSGAAASTADRHHETTFKSTIDGLVLYVAAFDGLLVTISPTSLMRLLRKYSRVESRNENPIRECERIDLWQSCSQHNLTLWKLSSS
jgi:transposase-like protein